MFQRDGLPSAEPDLQGTYELPTQISVREVGQ